MNPSEPIDDSNVLDLKRLGLVDIQKKGSRAQLRICKFLLRVIVDESKLLEKILTGGDSELPDGVLPDGVCLDTLLNTCRPYDADTQKAVQDVSFLVSLHAWLLLEQRQDSDAPTLLTLRPGAAVLGDRATQWKPSRATSCCNCCRRSWCRESWTRALRGTTGSGTQRGIPACEAFASANTKHCRAVFEKQRGQHRCYLLCRPVYNSWATQRPPDRGISWPDSGFPCQAQESSQRVQS